MGVVLDMASRALGLWSEAVWRATLFGMIIGGSFFLLVLICCLLLFAPLTSPIKNVLYVVLVVWLFMILMNSFGYWGTPWHHGIRAW